MFDPIPDPISGKSILPWAVPVTRALNAIGDKVGATARNERDLSIWSWRHHFHQLRRRP